MSPAYRTPWKGVPRRRSSSTTGWCTVARDLGGPGLVDAGHGRVGAHAAGVRASVAVEDPLVVLGGRERHGGLAVAQRQQRQLLALQVLLDDHAPRAEAAGDEEVLERRARRRLGRARRRRPCRRPGRRTSRRPGSASIGREAVLHGVARPASSAVGTPAAAMTSLAKAFERLQRAAARVGPEGRAPPLLQRVDEARDERRLGPDDGQPDVLVARPARRARRGRRRRRRTSARRPRSRGCRARTGPPAAAASAASARTIACSRPPEPTTRRTLAPSRPP